MAITSLSDLLTAKKQYLYWSAGITATNLNIMQTNAQSVGNTANGLVPSGATESVAWQTPAIRSFNGGKGYITGVSYSCGNPVNITDTKLVLFDRLFHAGPYSFNSNVALASQPSYSGRVPGGTDYSGIELWAENITGGQTGTPSVEVIYTNQAGTAGHTTGVIAAPNASNRTMWQLPLASGDSGVQKIENVQVSVASAGASFLQVFVARRVWATLHEAVEDTVGRFPRYGLTEIFDTSFLWLAGVPVGTSLVGNTYFRMEVAQET